MKVKLTQKELAKSADAIEDGKGVYLWDTELAGFGAYVSQRGTSFLVQKWAGGRGGKAVRYVVGKSRDGMTLEDARNLARAHIGDIARGINPVDVRRTARRETNDRLNGLKVSDAIDLYLPDGALASRYKAEARRALISAFKEASLYRVGVQEVTKSDIRKIIRAKDGMPAASRNLFAALRPFFKFCVDNEIIKASPLDGLTPPKPVASRDRLLSSDEIRALWLATESDTIPTTWQKFYRVLLLTGQRRDEVAGMRWDEIDFDRSVWTVPAMRAKNGKAHIVHLSDETLAELLPLRKSAKAQAQTKTQTVEGRGSDASIYVFPGARGDNHISGYSKMKTALDKAMSNHLKPAADWRLHDLRRTLASSLAEMGFPTDVADRILNHVSGSMAGVKGVYQRYEFLPERKKALDAWGNKVSSIINKIDRQ